MIYIANVMITMKIYLSKMVALSQSIKIPIAIVYRASLYHIVPMENDPALVNISATMKASSSSWNPFISKSNNFWWPSFLCYRSKQDDIERHKSKTKQ